MEKEITEYLVEKYKPKVIVLAGSRGVNKGMADSDWDLFLFCEGKHAGGFYEWNGQLLDLTFRNWQRPVLEDLALTIPYGPLWPVKVLFDDTNGDFDRMLENTKKIYELGPLKTYANACEERFKKLERWKGKIIKHIKDPEVQFYYAGYIYEFLVRVWFERQNLWPESPAKAFPYIKNKDKEFWELLSKFPEEKGEKLVELTGIIIEKLRLLKSSD